LFLEPGSLKRLRDETGDAAAQPAKVVWPFKNISEWFI